MGLLMTERPRSHPDQLLVEVPLPELRDLWAEAQHLTGVTQAVGAQPLHILRHSGPSVDVWFQRRQLAAVQARGRWTSPDSVWRYAKGGRAAERWSVFTAQQQSFAGLCAKHLREVLLGLAPPLRPPRHLGP